MSPSSVASPAAAEVLALSRVIAELYVRLDLTKQESSDAHTDSQLLGRTSKRKENKFPLGQQVKGEGEIKGCPSISSRQACVEIARYQSELRTLKLELQAAEAHVESLQVTLREEEGKLSQTNKELLLAKAESATRRMDLESLTMNLQQRGKQAAEVQRQKNALEMELENERATSRKLRAKLERETDNICTLQTKSAKDQTTDIDSDHLSPLSSVAPSFMLVLMDMDFAGNHPPGFEKPDIGGALAAEWLRNVSQKWIQARTDIPDDTTVVAIGVLSMDNFVQGATRSKSAANGRTEFERRCGQFSHGGNMFFIIDCGHEYAGDQKADKMIHNLAETFLPNPYCRAVWLDCLHDQGYIDWGEDPKWGPDHLWGRYGSKITFVQFREGACGKRYLNLHRLHPEIFFDSAIWQDPIRAPKSSNVESEKETEARKRHLSRYNRPVRHEIKDDDFPANTAISTTKNCPKLYGLLPVTSTLAGEVSEVVTEKLAYQKTEIPPVKPFRTRSSQFPRYEAVGTIGQDFATEYQLIQEDGSPFLRTILVQGDLVSGFRLDRQVLEITEVLQSSNRKSQILERLEALKSISNQLKPKSDNQQEALVLLEELKGWQALQICPVGPLCRDIDCYQQHHPPEALEGFAKPNNHYKCMWKLKLAAGDQMNSVEVKRLVSISIKHKRWETLGSALVCLVGNE